MSLCCRELAETGEEGRIHTEEKPRQASRQGLVVRPAHVTHVKYTTIGGHVYFCLSVWRSLSIRELVPGISFPFRPGISLSPFDPELVSPFDPELVSPLSTRN